MKKEKLAEELIAAENFYLDACRRVEDYRKECMRLLTVSDYPEVVDLAMRLCEFTTEKFYAGMYVEVLKKLEAEDMEVRG